MFYFDITSILSTCVSPSRREYIFAKVQHANNLSCLSHCLIMWKSVPFIFLLLFVTRPTIQSAVSTVGLFGLLLQLKKLI